MDQFSGLMLLILIVFPFVYIIYKDLIEPTFFSGKNKKSESINFFKKVQDKSMEIQILESNISQTEDSKIDIALKLRIKEKDQDDS